MAAVLQATVYGVNSTPIGNSQGTVMGFPAGGVIIRPVDSPAPTFSGVTMVSIIQVQPTGLNQPSPSYYSAQAVSTLITAANT